MNLETQKQGRSLPWFRVDNDSVDHPKVDALADRLNEPLALAYVIRLWAWTMRYAARGKLARGARASVERACGWRGAPGALWDALVETGWIDIDPDGTAEVHDWDEHQGAAVAKAEKDAGRKRNGKKPPAPRPGGSTEPPADRAGTGRDGTRRDETEQREEEAIPSSGKPPLQFDLAPPDPKTPLESWTREDFWRWAELRRRAAGLPQERWPNDAKLRDWWREARPAAEITVLQETYLRFGDAPHWQAAKPPLPFAGFMTQWTDFLPIRRSS